MEETQDIIRESMTRILANKLRKSKRNLHRD